LGPAGFEGRRLQGFCACLGAILFGCVRLDGVRFAEFGTWLGTRFRRRRNRLGGGTAAETRTMRASERWPWTRPSRQKYGVDIVRPADSSRARGSLSS